MPRRLVIAVIVIVISVVTASLVALAAAGAAHFGVDVPLRSWVLMGAALDVIFVYGVFERRAPFFGRIISRGRPWTPAIAITFDDGPTEPYTSQILDVLRAFEARATFFVLGARAERAPAVVKRAAREGHELGNHTWDHAALPLRSPAAIRTTIRRTSDLVENLTGARPRVFRAPFGWRNPWLGRAARCEACEPVAWTVGVYDTDRPGVEAVVSRAFDGLVDGSILLLHDGRSLDADPDASQVVEALPRIIREAQHRGLRLLTVSELLSETINRSDRSGRSGRFGIVKRGFRLVVLLVVLVATAIAIARSDPAAIGRALATMSWPWATLAEIINLIGVALDAIRLRIIVRAFGYVRLWHVVRAHLVGIMGNVLFPFKLGEGARAYMLTHRHELPAATAVTMVVLDRMLDALVLPLFVVVASVLLPLPSSVLRYRMWMLMALAGAVVAGVAAGRWLRARHASGRAPVPLAGTLDRIVAGVTILGHRRRLASAVAASLASWAARAAILWCMLQAFHLSLPLSATVTMLVIINLGIAVVATPGNIGTFELAAAAALTLWGVPAQTGLSIGIATHLVEVVPPLLIGLAVSVRSA
jgi:peptidoglycan-N-acetylglucosamine deacetylase